MDCNKFNGINCPQMTVSGIQKLWLIPFGDIYGYTYTNNNLNKITNYKLNLAPTEYNVLRKGDSFAQTLQDVDNKRSFNNALTVSFAKMTEEKRDEFNKLIGNDLTVIFKDKNGRCWLTGQSSPARIVKHESTTGSVSGDNLITADIICDSKEAIREITCYDGVCFANFNVQELRKSSFIINDATTVTYNGSYQIVADTTLLNYMPLQAIQPTLWNTNPAVLAQDIVTIQSLVGGYPTTNLQVELIYDSGLDIAYINLYSSDTSFNYLVMDSITYNSIIAITLRIWFVLGTGIDVNTTQITVADSLANTVYEGFIGDIMTGVWSGVTGVTEDAYIDVTTLYPSGTILTLTVLGNAQCETRDFTYVVEDQSFCNSTTTTDIVEGARYTFEFNEFTSGFKYREFQFYYQGIIIQLYKNGTLFHNSFAQFQTDLLNQLYQYQTDIDVSSVSIINVGGKITISFLSATNSAFCYIRIWGNNNGNSEYVNTYNAAKTVLGEFNTLTTAARIEFEDVNALLLAGFNGSLHDTNTGFIVEPTPSTTGNIDSIAFELLLNETDAYTQRLTSTNCPNTTNDILFTECYNENTVSDFGTLIKFSMQRRDLGEFWTLNTSAGTISFTIPNSLYPNEQYNDFCFAIKTYVSPTIRFDILSMYYENATQTWFFEAIIDTTNTFINLTADDFTTISTTLDTYFIDNHTITPIMHPSIIATHTIPTIDAANALITRSNNLKDALVETHRFNLPIALTHYYTGTGFLDITLNQLNNVVNGAYYFEFCETDNGAAIVTYTLTQPTLTDTFDFDTDLAAVGKTINDINAVRIKNDVGWVIDLFYTPYNLLDIDYILNAPYLDFTIFGKISNFNLMTRLQNMVIVTDVVSDLCPIFRPSDLAALCISYGKIDQYISSNFTGNDSTHITNTIQGNNVITPSSIVGIEIGMWVAFDNAFAGNWYQIVDITGGDLTLNQRILEQNLIGAVLYIAIVNTIPSDFNSNSWSSLSTISSFVWAKLNGYPTMLKLKDDLFVLTNVVDTNPSKLSFICLVKEVATHDEHIFTHRDNVTPTLIDCRVNNIGLYKMESDNGTGTPAQATAGTSTTYAMVEYTFTQATNSTTVKTALNGGIADTDTQTKTGTFTSTVQTFGGYFDGIDFQNGYAGEMVEIILLNDDTQSNIDKCIGYMAWKYDLTALLPINHPYKNIKP